MLDIRQTHVWARTLEALRVKIGGHLSPLGPTEGLNTVGSHLCKMLTNFVTEYQPKPLISQIPSKQHLGGQFSLRFQTPALPSDTHIRRGPILNPELKSDVLEIPKLPPTLKREIEAKKKKTKNKTKQVPKTLSETLREFRKSKTFVRSFKIHKFKNPETSVSFNYIIVLSINFTIFC
jgi:hypothetical protein